MAEKAATTKPYHSVYDGNFVDGYDTEDEATANVAARNAEAKSLGLSGTYEVVAGPRKG